jgi:hypothetical protein
VWAGRSEGAFDGSYAGAVDGDGNMAYAAGGSEAEAGRGDGNTVFVAWACSASVTGSFGFDFFFLLGGT